MARSRSVDGDRYRNRKLRKLGILPRFVWDFLCDACEDDEGRWVLDAGQILDAMFSRDDPDHTTVEQMEEALMALKRPRFLAVYRAGGARYAFLTGWFEHQNPQGRRPSPLPPPPENCAPITTGAQAEVIKEWYREKKGIKDPKNVWMKDAYRWWVQEGLAKHGRLNRDGSQAVDAPLTNGEPAVNLSDPLLSDTLTSSPLPTSDPSPKEGAETFPQSFPPPGLPESHSVISESETAGGNGEDPLVLQTKANLSLLYPAGATVGEIEQTCGKLGVSKAEQHRVAAAVMADPACLARAP